VYRWDYPPVRGDKVDNRDHKCQVQEGGGWGGKCFNGWPNGDGAQHACEIAYVFGVLKAR
jgi:hypothetical protein